MLQRLLGLGCSILRPKLSGIAGIGMHWHRKLAIPSRAYSGMSTSGLSHTQVEVREAMQKICQNFPDDYWTEKDRKSEYAGDLHRELANAGFLGICMPAEYGGSELGVSEATVMFETISESGAGVAGCQTIHANVYATVPILRFATPEQKSRYLPNIISGADRTCFGVTEPDTGLDTLKLRTKADRITDTKTGRPSYIISGQKIWITNAKVAERMVLLARTTPVEDVPKEKPTGGLSLFYCDIAKGKREGSVTVRPINKMGGRSVDANEVFFDRLMVDADDLIGSEGDGFRIILHGMNAERCFLAGEALGLGYAALRRATDYSKARHVFGRAIGQNQAIQHQLARSWCALEAAKMLTIHAARSFDDGIGVRDNVGKNSDASSSCQAEIGALCNAAKYVAAEAAFEACERAVMTHGGMGYASDFHVERYLRESFVPRLAPVSREMILNFIGQKVLGLPKSY